jgi:hypothetical protein
MLSLCVVLLCCSSGSYKWGGIGYLIGFFIFVNVVSAIVLSVIKRDRGHKSALVRHAEDYVTPTLRKQFIEKQLHSHRCASWAARCLPSSASLSAVRCFPSSAVSYCSYVLSWRRRRRCCCA